MNSLITNEQSERSVLGYLMLDGHLAQAACVRLRSEHFALSSHRDIYAAINRVLLNTNDASPNLVCDELGRLLGPVGGHAYVSSLTDGIYRNFDPTPRIDAILRAWKTRRGVTLCEQYRSQLLEEPDATLPLGRLQKDVLDTLADSAKHDDPCVGAYSDSVFEDLMTDCDRRPEEMGLSYGHKRLDVYVGGMRPREVTVIGADSGVGKSALMKQALAANCAIGKHCTVFSLEMPRKSLLHGLWAITSGVEYRKIRRPYLMRPEERAAVKSAYLTVKDWPLSIYEDPSLHIHQIAAFARMERRIHDTALVAIDYAQIAIADGRDDKERVSCVSRTMTAAAKSEGFHLMMLSQLRKKEASRSNYRPTIDDLAETRQLKNDAGVVVLVHRAWDEDRKEMSNSAELIIPKVRDGKTGTLSATFNDSNLTFEAAA